MPLRELGPAVGSPPPRLAGYVVRLRGLPFTASLTDVLQFFTGLDIVRSPPGVVFTCTPDGRPSGEAYVEFMTAAAQQSALQRHKQQLGNRYIELFPSSKGDLFHSIQHNGYYTGMGASVPTAETGQRQADMPLSPGSHVTTDTLRLRGLPYSAGLADVEAFFSGNCPLHRHSNPRQCKVITKNASFCMLCISCTHTESAGLCNDACMFATMLHASAAPGSELVA